MKSRPALRVSVGRPYALALGLTACFVLAAIRPVQAFVFASGEVSGSFDTTLSVGILSRLHNPDPGLYGLTNTYQGAPGQSYSVNGDDGDLNYPRGTASILYKITSDLELKWHNYGIFLRGYVFTDPRNEKTTRPKTPLTDLAKERVGQDAVLLDNYLTAKFDLGGMPATIRLGRQVINWGESTFIPNGINVINPIDVSRLRVPGAELREALLPVYAWDTSIAVTDALSIEPLWLAEFRRTEIDPAGTYFSTNDFASRGGSKVMLGFGALSDHDPANLGAIPRGRDHEGSNYNQWGLAAHYLARSLNNTDFGFYFLRYHSRLPLISARTPTDPISSALVMTTATNLATANLAPAMIANGYPAAGVPAAINTLLGAA
jgi:hypothetical protein